MMKIRKAFTRSATVIVATLLVASCQMDKRFSQLKTGMTKGQVLAIVGKTPTGDTVEGNVEKLQWETGSHYAKFKNGRLTDYGSE
jgi:Fe2+ transport system protein FeoA